MNNLQRWTVIAGFLCGLQLAAAAGALTCTDSSVPGVVFDYTEASTLIPKPNSCNLLPCYKPEHTGTVAVGNELWVSLRFPGNHQMQTNNHAHFFWFNTPEPFPGNCLPPPYSSCNPISLCGPLGAEILTDEGVAVASVSCTAFAAAAGSKVFSLSAYACHTFSGECTKKLDIPNLDLWTSLCLQPPRCEGTCGACALGGGTGAGPGGPGAPAAGRGATLRYRAGGAGHPAFAGAALWRTALGRYWSHDYAERIVQGPDSSHVWLLTRHATFREFRDADGDGFYERNTPSDEYRRLRKTAVGWELTDLDGSVQLFDAQGLWTRSEDSHGNAKTASYSGGRLARVDMPDGRAETFSYHPDGKLSAITEMGVDGSTARSWSYSWAGDDLARIDAPDGRAWTFLYDDARLPGYMTRMTLIGTDGSERIEGAWEYDAQGNLARSWKGDASAGGANAAEVTAYSYDNLYLPRETRVTDPLGKVTTYTLERDANGLQPRIKSVAGDCPTCGLGPNSQFSYADPAHPLLKTREVDARGTVTLYAYDANGRLTSKTEAAGTPLQRTTTWEYAGPFPGLATAVTQPSTSGTGWRRTILVYDGDGSLTSQTLEGTEAGSAFSFATGNRYNAAGQLEEVDPPGYGTADLTRFAYDPARGNLVALSRTDPLVGETRFTHDPWNRRTAVTDPNGVRTVTVYDALDRVEQLVQEGATPAENLTTLYEYTPFGDLARTVLPEGNVTEYGYDAAGRLISVERRPDRSTPGERTVYTLDRFGHRIREELQRWDGAAWVTDSFTAYVYSTRCQLDKVVHADGSATEFAYDCNGNLERTWDANHPAGGGTAPATTSYEYDFLNRLKSASQPWVGAGGGRAVTRYEYDVQDHLVKVTDAEGNVTRYTYSDRDLMTQQISEVSGTTEYRYNEHEQLTTETDARGVTVTRTVDALDRVTFADYSDDALDTRYAYDDPLIPFSKGRLTAIVRDGKTVAYGYDRFGRTTQDGALSYGYDRNGNRREIGYPGDVTATYGFDFADREQRLTLNEPGQAPRTVASDAWYLASGPLTYLLLGNGLAESHTFDERYFPEAIRVAGKLAWQYATDDVGNVLSIQDALDPAKPRRYAYQDVAYFLTQGDGPWGRLAWSYDKIGNRLSQTRDGASEAYTYLRNAAGGNNPKLTAVTPGASSPTSYHYDAAGDQTFRAAADEKVRFSYSAERRLAQISRDAPADSPAVTRITYDGRGFLETATYSPAAAASFQARTWATYSSDGILLHKFSETRPDSLGPRDEAVRDTDSFVLYFAGRPVALLETTKTVAPGAPPAASRRLLYLTTDHLGTPALATDESGNSAWTGGFSPFGEDFAQAQESGIFLRFPGHWVAESWVSGLPASEVFYNVHRWYAPARGRYTQLDPVWNPRRSREINPYLYVAANPINGIDIQGLVMMTFCCNDWDKEHLDQILRQVGEIQHAYINQLPLPPALGFGPHAVTTCEIFTPPGPGKPSTAYRNFGDGTCADACTRVHEQSHRDECRRNDYLTLELGRAGWVGEALAYAKEADCLTKAILQGQVTVDVDPMDEGNNLE